MQMNEKRKKEGKLNSFAEKCRLQVFQVGNWRRNRGK
jgi:hypothetical protein